MPDGFQSPSLRGSGLFPPSSRRTWRRPARFQSPSLRGSGLFRINSGRWPATGTTVSIPFIAGQWSLRTTFPYPIRVRHHVSIPFIAGQWSLRGGRDRSLFVLGFMFQSPSLRGSGLFAEARAGRLGADLVSIPFIAGQWSLPGRSAERGGAVALCFNPLHCGAVVSSWTIC